MQDAWSLPDGQQRRTWSQENVGAQKENAGRPFSTDICLLGVDDGYAKVSRNVTERFGHLQKER